MKYIFFLKKKKIITNLRNWSGYWSCCLDLPPRTLQISHFLRLEVRQEHYGNRRMDGHTERSPENIANVPRCTLDGSIIICCVERSCLYTRRRSGSHVALEWRHLVSHVFGRLLNTTPLVYDRVVFLKIIPGPRILTHITTRHVFQLSAAWAFSSSGSG